MSREEIPKDAGRRICPKGWLTNLEQRLLQLCYSQVTIV